MWFYGRISESKRYFVLCKNYSTVGIFDVCQLTIRTVKEDYFVGCDKVDKHAYLFSYSDLGEVVFHDRKQALDKVLVAENNKKKINNEVFYEEY